MVTLIFYDFSAGWTRQVPAASIENGNGNGHQHTRQGGARVINAPPVVMNHLLLGKKPLINAKPRKGPPPGISSNLILSGSKSNLQQKSPMLKFKYWLRVQKCLAFKTVYILP